MRGRLRPRLVRLESAWLVPWPWNLQRTHTALSSALWSCWIPHCHEGWTRPDAWPGLSPVIVTVVCPVPFGCTKAFFVSSGKHLSLRLQELDCLPHLQRHSKGSSGMTSPAHEKLVLHPSGSHCLNSLLLAHGHSFTAAHLPPSATVSVSAVPLQASTSLGTWSTQQMLDKCC